MSNLTKGRSGSIHLGERSAGGSVEPFTVDVNMLLRSNLLLQANSGGGKSWALRRMLEKCFGIVPQIVLDPEGEFATLREKFDFVLVGGGGETPADVRSAPLLARKLLELGASAVVDLYELSPGKKLEWAAAFLGALVDAPKGLWRDLLVYVDEAHLFAPEHGHGSSESSAEKGARASMVALASRGRKRGYGLVAATQRLGKLSKDLAAELKNVLVGLTFIDVDRDRAAESLGVSRAGRQSFYADLKVCRPGDFYALGRALSSTEVSKIVVGGVETSHPEAGRRQVAPPPPTDKIKHLLPQLADLPREAEEKAETEKDLRIENDKLRKKVEDLESRLKAKIQSSGTSPAEIRRTEELVKLSRLFSSSLRLKSLERDCREAERSVTDLVGDCRAMLSDIAMSRCPVAPEKDSGRSREEVKSRCSPRDFVTTVPMSERIGKPPLAEALRMAPREVKEKDARSRDPDNRSGRLCVGEMRILIAVAQHDGQGGTTREQLTILCGYKRSSRDTYLQKLRSAGLVEARGDRIFCTPRGEASLGPDYQPLPTGKDLLDYWRKQLSEGERKILNVVVGSYPDGVSRETIGDSTNYRRSSLDTYLQRLRSRQLVHALPGGEILASDLLFD